MFSTLPPLEEEACLAELKLLGGALFDASAFFIPIIREPLCDAGEALEVRVSCKNESIVKHVFYCKTHFSFVPDAILSLTRYYLLFTEIAI
jgi:hypothetical protein